MSKISIKDGAEGVVKATIDDIDLQATTMNDLISQLVEAGTLSRPSNGESWKAISNETNNTIRENGKSLADLGFKDGDTITFVTKSEGACLR